MASRAASLHACPPAIGIDLPKGFSMNAQERKTGPFALVFLIVAALAFAGLAVALKKSEVPVSGKQNRSAANIAGGSER